MGLNHTSKAPAAEPTLKVTTDNQGHIVGDYSFCR